jgi:hypothetical protein
MFAIARRYVGGSGACPVSAKRKVPGMSEARTRQNSSAQESARLLKGGGQNVCPSAARLRRTCRRCRLAAQGQRSGFDVLEAQREQHSISCLTTSAGTTEVAPKPMCLATGFSRAWLEPG